MIRSDAEKKQKVQKGNIQQKKGRKRPSAEKEQRNGIETTVFPNTLLLIKKCDVERK